MNEPRSRTTGSFQESRILWLTERFPPDAGGMAASCGRLTSALRRRGCSLDVYVFRNRHSQAHQSREERDGGVDFQVPIVSSPGLAAQIGWSLVKQEHHLTPYTCVVGFGANLPGFTAVTYASWLRLPSLVLVRGNDFDRDWFDPDLGFWVRESLSRADRIGAVSRENAERIHVLFPDRDVRFIPNGVDPSMWGLLPPDRERRALTRQTLALEGRRVVGIFGELKFKKRIPLWIGALRDAGLLDRVGLLIVGRIEEETRQILQDPVLAPRSLFIPFCPRENLPGLYGACDFIAIPSLFDGMPNVLLEAMASRVVPIVSDAGGMKEVVIPGQTGFIFPAEDRAAAGRVTAQALSLSDEELAAMGDRARDHVIKHFSLAEEIARLEEIFGSFQPPPGKHPERHAKGEEPRG